MTSRPRILVTNRIHAEVADFLGSVGETDINADAEPLAPEELRRRLAGASAMMGFMTDRVDENLLGAAPDLRIVACALKGFDNYDVDACTRRGIWVSFVPDLLTEPTAELALGLAIALGRNMRAAAEHVRAGHFAGWRPTFYGKGFGGSVAAVVGLGKVGSAILDRLQGFGCARIFGVDPHRVDPRTEPTSLEAAFAAADFLFLAVPLIPGTRGMVSADILADARPGQILVNVGRGSVIDEEAVADALDAGRIAGYGADVFAFEDWALADRTKDISERLRLHPNALLTPHIGSAVRDVRKAIEMRAAANIVALLTGSVPPDAVNRPGSP